MGTYSLLQIVGSTLIGGFIVLMLFRFNSSTGEKKHRYDTQSILQTNMKKVTELLDSDFKNIGYCKDYTLSKETFEDAIITATDQVFAFKTDVPVSKANPFGDGIVDEIKYYLGTYITTTPNSEDRYLFREKNGGIPLELNYGITQLKFKYYNSTGDSLSYPIDLKQIAVVEYTIILEDIYGYKYQYNIENTDRKKDETYYMTKSKTAKIAIKNLKFR